MGSVTKTPGSVNADGWNNPQAFGQGHGLATAEGGSAPDVCVGNFGFSVPNAPTKIVIGVKVGGVPIGAAQAAVDRIQPTIDGTPVGDPLGHGAGVQSSPEWVEQELYSGDLAAAGITLDVLNSDRFGVVVSLYDRDGAEGNSVQWSAGPVRVRVEY